LKVLLIIILAVLIAGTCYTFFVLTVPDTKSKIDTKQTIVKNDSTNKIVTSRPSYKNYESSDIKLPFAGNSFSGKCVYVADGDTINVMKGNIPVKIRLFGVDCPEKSQAYGQDAKEFTTSLVKDQIVTVIPKKQDNYGRTIASISIDGKNLSYLLIKAGYGWHYKMFSKSRELAKAEREARIAERGLWQQDNPQKPWNYRHGTSNSNRDKMEDASMNDNENTPVFVTTNGSKYHREGCKSLKGNYIEKTLEEVRNEGYSPCGWCKPPQ